MNNDSDGDNYATGTHYIYEKQEQDKKVTADHQFASAEDDKNQGNEEVTALYFLLKLQHPKKLKIHSLAK